MSRLHEVKVKGLDNYELLPHHQTEHIRTYGDKLLATLGSDSPRKGTRHSRTIKKTAIACGSNYVPNVLSWGQRSQVEAGKAALQKHRKGQMKQAKSMRKEGRSAMKASQ